MGYSTLSFQLKYERWIIIGLVISAIFIITVLFFTVINYYVWKDKPHERPQTKSLDLPVQEEESRGQVESGISTLPQDNGIVSQPLFTIQAGAFNDAYYAKALKTRLNKKGYRAFITISFSKKGRFYKVLVGKFSNRGKAEMLSAKIKRAEGIQTFVTLWKKQYLKNSKASSLKVSVHKCHATQKTQALYFSYYVS
ncbi:MAG: SPOR domain-containing protein [Nitrospirota bacterium]